MRNKLCPSLFFYIILFIKPSQLVTNLSFGSKHSSHVDNKYIGDLTVNRLNLQWKRGGYHWVGTTLNVEISSGIYRLFNIFLFV
jgi:hypothetical protein